MQKKSRKFYPIDNARWEKFGEWLKTERKKLKLTQTDLAMGANLSMMQVFRIENGKSSTTKASAMALGRIVGADDVTTLKIAGFETAVMTNIPKEVRDLLRTYGNLLSDEDFDSIANFVIERSKRNSRKVKKTEI